GGHAERYRHRPRHHRRGAHVYGQGGARPQPAHRGGRRRAALHPRHGCRRPADHAPSAGRAEARRMTATEVTTWHLEQRSPDDLRPAPAPPGVSLAQVEIPSPAFSRFLYAAVGSDWWWYSRLPWT